MRIPALQGGSQLFWDERHLPWRQVILSLTLGSVPNVAPSTGQPQKRGHGPGIYTWAEVSGKGWARSQCPTLVLWGGRLWTVAIKCQALNRGSDNY